MSNLLALVSELDNGECNAVVTVVTGRVAMVTALSGFKLCYSDSCAMWLSLQW